MEYMTLQIQQFHRIQWPSMFIKVVCFCLLSSSVFAQDTNEITNIDPNSGLQGETSLLVTFTLDTDAPPAPPAGVMPDSVMIGSMTGLSVTHDNQYTVTALFNIPSEEPTGLKDASITFTTPHGTLVFSMIDGFTVVEGSEMPPTITQHPQSQTVPPGGSVTFTVAASGTAPLEYQWQKDGEDISDAEETSFSIDAVSEDDAGNYRCVVSNDFGTTTSNEALLTVSELPIGAYPVVDTAQDVCFDNDSVISDPEPGDPFFGQDAQIDGNLPSYTISTDGLSVYDNVTGLTWTRDADWDDDGDIDVNDKVTFAQAPSYAATLNTQNYGGFNDWRVPGIKELYSLMDFRGTDPMLVDSTDPIPFIDTDYFYFAYGDTGAGERIIDSQWVTTTLYLDTVMGSQEAMFGVNFADGRIKGYPTSGKAFYARFCRGNTDYGINNLADNGDGTITDRATGLMWTQDDRGDGVSTGPRSGILWEEALAWVQQKNDENYLGYSDWRLPNAKELQSILDYSRSPGTTGSAAIDPLFNTTQITNELGQDDYPWFWSSTTHIRQDGSGSAGAYVCFGRGTGYMSGNWLDVHGAGCQRSDRKDGNFAGYTYVHDGYYFGDAPQGDAARMYNYVRLVRDTADCPADLTSDAQVNIDDIFAVLGLWGDCPDPCPPYCAGDLTEDCTVNIDDIFAILGQWGPCN